jgi:hypothetical protein
LLRFSIVRKLSMSLGAIIIKRTNGGKVTVLAKD